MWFIYFYFFMWFIKNFSFIIMGGGVRDSCDFSECYYLYDNIQMSKFFLAHFFSLILQLKTMMKLLELKQMHYQVNKYLFNCYIQNIEADWVY